MLTNPSAKRILLYGDSLVFGKEPGKPNRSTSRFSLELQKSLGEEYEVIEEGLRARNLKGENGFFPERDGLEQFGPIYGSHIPLSLVIILLGTNDCNAKPSVQPEEIVAAFEQYNQKIKEWSDALVTEIPKLLIVAPPEIKSEYYDSMMAEIFNQESGSKSRILPKLYAEKAKQLNAEFFDASKVCSPSKIDGIHLDDENNIALGEALAEKVKSL